MLCRKVVLFLFCYVQEQLNGNIYPDELHKNVNQIESKSYHDYTIDERYFCKVCKYKKVN